MDFYFLLFSLIFPRITMLAYFISDSFPANSVPIWGDVLLGVFLPRVLILIYIYQNMGVENVWFIAHLIALFLTSFGTGRKTKSRFWKSKKD